MTQRCANHTNRATLPPLCHICQRLKVEEDIATRAVDALLAAGFSLNINNGDNITELPQATAERERVLGALFATDDEWLLVYRDMTRIGWIRFVYGNSGYDVISDYTTNLEDVLKPVNDYADTLA